MLIAVTLIWGSTFALVKDATHSISPAVLIAWRFTVALVPLLFFLHGDRTLWRDGILLGAMAMVSYATQTIGLQYTSANRGAFITGLNVVMVPLAVAALGGRRITPAVWAAVAVALGGIALLSFEGGPINVGDAWIFACAVAYVAYIVYLERVAGQHRTLPLAAVQVLTVAVLGWLWVAPQALSGSSIALPADLWGAVLYLGVIATAGTTLLQTLGQKYVSAPEAALIYALEPVAAAVFAYFWIHEVVGPRGLLGGLLVVIGMALSQLPERKRIVPLSE